MGWVLVVRDSAHGLWWLWLNMASPVELSLTCSVHQRQCPCVWRGWWGATTGLAVCGRLSTTTRAFKSAGLRLKLGQDLMVFSNSRRNSLTHWSHPEEGWPARRGGTTALPTTKQCRSWHPHAPKAMTPTKGRDRGLDAAQLAHDLVHLRAAVRCAGLRAAVRRAR